jgi:hypothetical protein
MTHEQRFVYNETQQINKLNKILSIKNSSKYRQKINCNCTDCGGSRLKGVCKFEHVYYRKKHSSLRITFV